MQFFFHPPVTSFLFGPNISSAPSVYVPPLVSETKFRTHKKTTGKIIVVDILIFRFFDNRWEDRRLWTEW
jgi:hypothetical protein